MALKKRLIISIVGLFLYSLQRFKFFGIGEKLDPIYQKYLFLNLSICITWVFLVPSLLFSIFPEKVKKSYLPSLGTFWVVLAVVQLLWNALDIPTYRLAIDSTYLLPVVCSLSLAPLSRRFSFFILIPYILLLLANGLYSRVFLKPLALSDFSLLGDYISIWSTSLKLAVSSLTLLAVGTLFFVWKKKNRTFWIESIICVVTWLLFFLLPYLPVKKNEFRASSPFEHLKTHGYLNVLHVQPRITNVHPSKKEITTATNILGYPALHNLKLTPLKPEHYRNLYVILIESFADLSRFKNMRISPEPFDPRFMKAWKKASYSSTLPPVFGGRTAQSEFEVACGVPANLVPGMAFTDYLKDDVKCLPNRLAQLGYSTAMTHGFEPEIFQSNYAYPHLGFQTVITRENYQIPSTQLVPDEWMYSKMLSTSFWGTKEPRAFFLNTSLTHTPYDAKASDAAIPISVESSNLEATVFAKRAYEASRFLMDYIESIRKKDPDALIVAYGDHLPPLPGFWNESLGQENTPERYLKQYTTPILLIDGKKGPASLGVIPLYFLPYEILWRLGLSDKETKQFLNIRPVDGLILINNSESKSWELRDTTDPLAKSLKTRFFQILQE